LTSFLPPEFTSSMSKLDHFDPDSFLSAHDSEIQVVSVHMNPGKPLLRGDQWNENLNDPPFEISGKVPWAPDAFYLSSRPSFTLDPLFHAGCYYVQEASGMFLAFALKQTLVLAQKMRILDLCAAPGGKSTLIQSLISPDSLLVSNEVIKTRVPVLAQNLTKWGQANGIISSNDPAHFKKIPGFFDLILIDAPCSGSGLFRKDPEAAAGWSPDLVKLCSQRQRRILSDAWDCLKENGMLIYSTCSYSQEENEDILDTILHQYPCESISLSPDPDWNIVETISEAGAYGYRFYPDKVPGEGFFLAVIQKKQETTPALTQSDRIYKMNSNPSRISASASQQVRGWIEDGSWQFFSISDSIHALPVGMLPDFDMLKNNLYLKKAGIRIGKEGENDWIPDHEMALAKLLKEDFPAINVEKADALRYLRGEPVEFEKNARGWRIIKYMGHRLGWVKLVGSRMNNYYPKSWRIRQ
jgi:16S rRNA C967 or C1407 C5-methylase (RsmB/RsmF family)/NOL1/NOP2/fmu family ribosome biogenesis protein